MNIGSDAVNSKEEGEEEELIGKDEADGETGKNSEESNEVSEEESSDATSSAVDEKIDLLSKKPTVRPNTKSRWSGKSSSSQRLANPVLSILLLGSLPLFFRF